MQCHPAGHDCILGRGHTQVISINPSMGCFKLVVNSVQFLRRDSPHRVQVCLSPPPELTRVEPAVCQKGRLTQVATNGATKGGKLAIDQEPESSSSVIHDLSNEKTGQRVVFFGYPP